MNVKLDTTIARAFYGRFPKLYPAQEATIAPLLSGGNLILTSGTGSGKTEAVAAPLVSRYWHEAVRDDRLFLLYVAPTKALINDIVRRLEPALAQAGTRLGIRHGDRDDLPKKPHILVTTPESLEVMLSRNEPALKDVQAAILDEIHLLYNTQRGLQLAILLRRLKAHTGKPLQWAALSATIHNLAAIRDFFFGTDEPAEFLRYPATRPIDACIKYIETESDFRRLFKKLTSVSGRKLLVFADSRKTCERLCAILRKDAGLKENVFTHYSSMSADTRLETEKKFGAMRTAVCVATSTLELGIDIGDIDATVLWGVPPDVKAFLQRIGRSNRRSAKTNVICLIPDTSEAPLLDALLFASNIEAARTGKIPEHEPHDLFGAVVQQILSIAVSQENEWGTFAELSALLSWKPHITEDVLLSVLAELVDSEHLKRHPHKKRWCADEKTFTLKDQKQIYGNFPLGSQHVNLFHDSQRIGDVPLWNRFSLNPGDTVRFAGRNWKIKRFTHEGIKLEPCPKGSSAKDFRYGGKNIPREPEAIDGIWRILDRPTFDFSVFSKRLEEKLTPVVTLIQRLAKQEDTLLFIKTTTGVRYYTFAGQIVNKAICQILGQEDADADECSILANSEINWRKLPDRLDAYAPFIPDLMNDPDRLSIFQNMLPNELLKCEYLQNWLKSCPIAEILSRLAHAHLKELTPVEADSLNAVF